MLHNTPSLLQKFQLNFQLAKMAAPLYWQVFRQRLANKWQKIVKPMFLQKNGNTD